MSKKVRKKEQEECKGWSWKSEWLEIVCDLRRGLHLILQQRPPL